MASEAARLPVRRIVVGYVLLSLLALAAGMPILDALSWNTPSFLIVHVVPGPLTVISYAIWGRGMPIADWFFHGPTTIIYLLATLLLAIALVLALRRTRFVRWIGYGLAAVAWIGAGSLMTFALAYG